MFHRTFWLVVESSLWSADVGPDEDVDEDAAFQHLRQATISAMEFGRLGLKFEELNFEVRAGAVFLANTRVYNHAGESPDAERRFLKKIAELAPATYGVCYMTSDEPGECYGRYLVLKLKNTALTESFDDHFDGIVQ